MGRPKKVVEEVIEEVVEEEEKDQTDDIEARVDELEKKVGVQSDEPMQFVYHADSPDGVKVTVSEAEKLLKKKGWKKFHHEL